jgi:galactonate dehydratase
LYGFTTAYASQNPDFFRVEDGYINVPTAPGLGIEMDEELIRKEALSAPAWRNPVRGFL